MKVDLFINAVVTTKIAILMFHNLHNPHINLYNFQLVKSELEATKDRNYNILKCLQRI